MCVCVCVYIYIKLLLWSLCEWMAALSGHSFLLGVISYVLFVKFVDPWYTTCVQGDPVSFDYSIKLFIYQSINVCVCVCTRACLILCIAVNAV